MRLRTAIVGTIIGTAAGVAISRTVQWRRTWGVDAREMEKVLTGDDLVPTPSAIETRGITIDAPPAAVWPWLVQMGYGRAGWYSYDQLDTRGKSADTIVPAWQTIEVGDVMPFSPDGGFAVRVVEPGRALVLSVDTGLLERQAEAARPDVGTVPKADMPAGLAASSTFLEQIPRDFAASWAFVLEPLDGGRTRLIERFRIRFGESGPSFRVIGPLMGFGVVVMLQRQMLGIRDRAQRTVVAPPMAVRTDGPVPAKTNGLTPAIEETEVIATPG